MRNKKTLRNSFEKTENLNSSFSARFYFIFILFLFWTLSQILIPIKFLPYEILVKIEFLKTTIPVTLIVISVFLYRDLIKIDRFLWPFFAFLVFIIGIGIFKYIFFPSFPVEDIIKYVLWIIAMFFVLPRIFNTLAKIRFYLKYSLILLCISLIIASLVIVNLDLDITLFLVEERAELIYGNPLYFAGILYTILCSSLILLRLSPSNFGRVLLYIIVFTSVLLIYLATARTFLLASLILFIVYYYNTNDNFKKLFWLFIIPVIILIIFFFKDIDINAISSNRLSIWKNALYNDMSFWKFIFGTTDSGYIKELSLESGEIVVQTMQRFAVDNSYIEIFINTGIIGFILFIMGLHYFLSKNYIRIIFNKKHYKKSFRFFYLSYAVFISLLIAGFFYGHYPSLGNTLNSVLFPVTISVILLYRTEAIKIIRNQKNEI